MKKIIYRIFPVYIILFIFATLFYLYSGGMILTSDYFSVMFSFSIVLAALTLMLVMMGKPPVGKPVTGKWDSIVIDLGTFVSRRRQRKWASCSWGFDNISLYIYTFGKIKEKADIKEITDIFTNDSGITVVFKDRSWVISGDGYNEVVETLKEKAGLKK